MEELRRLCRIIRGREEERAGILLVLNSYKRGERRGQKKGDANAREVGGEKKGPLPEPCSSSLSIRSSASTGEGGKDFKTRSSRRKKKKKDPNISSPSSPLRFGSR